MTPTRTKTIAFVSLILLFEFACSKSKPPPENNKWAHIEIDSDTELSFWSEASQSEGTPGGPAPFILCDLQGPHNTLVLARMLSEPTKHPLAPGCDKSDDPYSSLYASFDAEIVQTAAGRSDVPSPVELIFFPTETLGGYPELSEGPTILASIRESDGTWFIDAWVYADVMNSDVGSRSDQTDVTVDLPTTWGEMVQRSSAIQSDYSTTCGHSPAPPFSYSADRYQEYRYVYQGPKPFCDTQNDGDVGESPDAGPHPSPMSDAGDGGEDTG